MDINKVWFGKSGTGKTTLAVNAAIEFFVRNISTGSLGLILIENTEQLNQSFLPVLFDDANQQSSVDFAWNKQPRQITDKMKIKHNFNHVLSVGNFGQAYVVACERSLLSELQGINFSWLVADVDFGRKSLIESCLVRLRLPVPHDVRSKVFYSIPDGSTILEEKINA